LPVPDDYFVRVSSNCRGGTPTLDALLVRFVLRPGERIQFADLAASLQLDLDRLGRAVDVLIADGAISVETVPPNPQTWVSLP
jgi:hypothetical protein